MRPVLIVGRRYALYFKPPDRPKVWTLLDSKAQLVNIANTLHGIEFDENLYVFSSSISCYINFYLSDSDYNKGWKIK